MTLPAKDSLATYGGALRNYLGGVTDPTTDRDAGAMNRALTSLAGSTHTIARAYVRFRLNGAQAPLLMEHDAVWGESPDVAPILAHIAVGQIRVTWPPSVFDELGDPHVVIIRAGWAQIRTPSAQHLLATVVPQSTPNVVDIYLRDMTQTPSEGTGQEFDLIAM